MLTKTLLTSVKNILTFQSDLIAIQFLPIALRSCFDSTLRHAAWASAWILIKIRYKTLSKYYHHVAAVFKLWFTLPPSRAYIG